MGNTRRTWSSESTKEASYELRNWSSKHRAYMILHQVLFVYIIAFYLSVFMGLLNMRKSESLILESALFLLLRFPVRFWYDGFCLILLYSYVAMFGCYVLETCSFLMSKRKGVDPEGRRRDEELGGENEGKTIIRICCMRGESIFKQRKRKGKKTEGISTLQHFLIILIPLLPWLLQVHSLLSFYFMRLPYLQQLPHPLWLLQSPHSLFCLDWNDIMNNDETGFCKYPP